MTKSSTRVNRSTSDGGRSDDDDGPRPLRNNRQSQKYPNASDRFYSDHQAEYEARGKHGEDRVAIVEEHNSGYPKMRDELDNRRATSKPTALSSARNVDFQGDPSRCPVCGRFKRDRPTKRKNQRTKSRITKRKPRALKKFRANKSRNKAISGLISKNLVISTGDAHKGDKYRAAAGSKIIRIKAESDVGSRKSERDSKNADADSQNPDSNPSVSSYDSFLSEDHEPMDH